jgi:hypothetical protein
MRPERDRGLLACLTDNGVGLIGTLRVLVIDGRQPGIKDARIRRSVNGYGHGDPPEG